MANKTVKLFPFQLIPGKTRSPEMVEIFLSILLSIFPFVSIRFLTKLRMLPRECITRTKYCCMDKGVERDCARKQQVLPLSSCCGFVDKVPLKSVQLVNTPSPVILLRSCRFERHRLRGLVLFTKQAHL